MAHFLERLLGLGHYPESPLVMDPWAGLSVVEGTRWKEAGMYSNFHLKAKNGVEYPLPIIASGGFILHRGNGFQIAIRPESSSSAVIEVSHIDSSGNADIIFWDIDEKSMEGSIRGDPIMHVVDMNFIENLTQLQLPDNLIVFRKLFDS